MSAEEILARAAELVERPGGWCQGAYVIGLAVCARGAIFRAEGAPLDNSAMRDVAMCGHAGSMASFDASDALREEIGGGSIVRWNDARGQTALEVATALRNAKRWL